jgi:hypothetical protein
MAFDDRAWRRGVKARMKRLIIIRRTGTADPSGFRNRRVMVVLKLAELFPAERSQR